MQWITPSALIVGSAPISTALSGVKLDGMVRMAINNAWRLRDDFHYSIYADDFPEQRRPDYSLKHISAESYMPAFNAAGGITFGGATMALAAGYWAIYKKSPWILGFYGCDMVYPPGQTHFYGAGTADPLRADITLRSLEAKTARLFLHALAKGTICINYSGQEGTRLVMPRLPLERRPNTLLEAHRLRRRVVKSVQYKTLMAIFSQCKELEARAPFRALKTNYWENGDEKNVAYIDKVDSEWARAVPLISTLIV
ncbi:hypothetical protein [Achromobacter aegrifaciens]